VTWPCSLSPWIRRLGILLTSFSCLHHPFILVSVQSSGARLRRWMCLCIGKLWQNFEEAKAVRLVVVSCEWAVGDCLDLKFVLKVLPVCM